MVKLLLVKTEFSNEQGHNHVGVVQELVNSEGEGVNDILKDPHLNHDIHKENSVMWVQYMEKSLLVMSQIMFITLSLQIRWSVSTEKIKAVAHCQTAYITL